MLLFCCFDLPRLQCIQKCTINKRYNDKMKKTVTERNIKVENASILIVDDEKAIVDMIKRVLEKEGYRNILDAASAEEAIPVVKANKVDLIVLDVMMGGMSGLDRKSVV